jgi:hypothetical protein
MKQERAHGKDAARWNDAVHGMRGCYRACDLLVGENSKTVRTGHDSKRAVRRP